MGHVRVLCCCRHTRGILSTVYNCFHASISRAADAKAQNVMPLGNEKGILPTVAYIFSLACTDCAVSLVPPSIPRAQQEELNSVELDLFFYFRALRPRTISLAAFPTPTKAHPLMATIFQPSLGGRGRERGVVSSTGRALTSSENLVLPIHCFANFPLGRRTCFPLLQDLRHCLHFQLAGFKLIR